MARFIGVAALIHVAFVSARMRALLYALANHASILYGKIGVIQ